jgi:hypothetical protein
MALVITASKLVHRAGSLSNGAHFVNGETLPHYSAAGSTGVVTWSDGGKGGSFVPATGIATDYTPLNRTQSIVITATDSGAGGVGTKSLSVVGTFPLQPDKGYELDTDDDTQESLARDKSRTTRQDGPVTESRQLELLARIVDERIELKSFWLCHRKVIHFYYYDVATGELVAEVWFDSGLKQRVAVDAPNSFDMSVVIKGNLP